MLGFSYMNVRGTEFPLWFVILMSVLLVGAVVLLLFFVLKEAKNTEDAKKKREGKNDKLTFMGKDRLVRILLHYIRGRYGEEMYNGVVSKLKECKEEKFYVEQKRKTGTFYTYTQTSFPACNEWVKCICPEYDFLIEVCGKKSKRVIITDCHIKNGKQIQYDRIFTFYDENFVPKPNETLLCGTTAQVPSISPNAYIKLTDENTTYNGIERDACVCYDIAKVK